MSRTGKNGQQTKRPLMQDNKSASGGAAVNRRKQTGIKEKEPELITTREAGKRSGKPKSYRC